ncbi:WD repeat and HMG-box DNA-binding protein 1 [Onthophagus taurus]|uniref:WD repeat and HMG-box DNA-binding protein 1 n=1 Tax=Onthophagus taurus TaxID=166361 RepID=UPI0039BDC244
MSSNRKPSRYAHSAGHTDVCYSEDGLKLITCGTDGDIRMWASIDDYDPFQTCVGEWSLCVRQKNESILISTDSNSVQLLNYPGGDRDAILTKCSAPITHMAIGKQHNFVAIASEDTNIKLIDLANPKELPRSYLGVNGPPLSVALCPEAKILAASAGDGFLRFWDVESCSTLKQLQCDSKTNSFVNATLLCRMDFEPTSGKHVAYPQKNTVVILNTTDWSNVCTLTTDTTDSNFSIVQYSPCGKFIAAAAIKGEIIVWAVESQEVVEFSQHSSSKAVCALAWNPLGNGEIAFCDIEGELGVVTDCTANTTLKADNKSDVGNDVDFGDIQFDDDDEDNENAVSLEKIKNNTMGCFNDDEVDKASSIGTRRSRPATPETPMQATFMPSSTPEHLDPRYLCWNEVGIVRCYGSVNEEDGNKSIEAEFHDSTFHSSMMVQNFNGYTMSSLSTSVFTLANSEQIQVIPLLSGTKDWILAVEENISIICIAASSKLVCFASSNYLVHVCTTYGTQKGVFSIPGPVVCMSAHDSSLLIAYHSSKPRGDDQCLKLMLVKFEGLSLHKTDLENTLGPECTLNWMGFTDMGSPALLDSNETLFIYLTRSNIWVPICDTNQHTAAAADGFFVTTVSESLATVIGIRCKGSKYPNFVPRPTLSELPLQPTFVEITSEKAQLGANLFMWSNLQVEDTEKKCKEAALKSFALACKNSLDQRAFELIELVQNKQVTNLAVKYATKLERKRLLEKLIELQAKLESETGDEITELSQIEQRAVVKPNRKLLMNLSDRSTPKNKLRKHLNMENIENTSNNLNAQSLLSTPTLLVDNSFDTNTTMGTTQDIEETKNPFAKNLKKATPTTSNPLSLTDKFAGYKLDLKENGAKRKQPETNIEATNPKEKQRKLAQFSFTKKT